MNYLKLIEPDHLDQTVGNDEHFSCHLPLAADEVTRREYVRLHLENEVMQELWLALLEYRHLGK